MYANFVMKNVSVNVTVLVPAIVLSVAMFVMVLTASRNVQFQSTLIKANVNLVTKIASMAAQDH